jgi:hypothetical protein
MTIHGKLERSFLLLGLATLVACAGCAHTPQPEPASAASAEHASAPDTEKAKKHLQAHVSYPATRAQILAACAQTREFTAAEKQWFTDRLPDGSYASADQVMAALGI